MMRCFVQRSDGWSLIDLLALFRYEGTKLDLGEGTGLGLYVTRMHMESIRGKCGFHANTDAIGSTFWIQFPDLDQSK